MSSARVRYVAYAPRLDLAIRAVPVYKFHAPIKRPEVLTERAHADIVFTKRGLGSTDSASYGWQAGGSTNPGGPSRDPGNGGGNVN